MSVPEAVPPAPKPPEPWHQNVAFTTMALLIAGPIALPLLWFNRRIPLLVRIGGTVLIVGVAFYTVRVTVGLYQRLQSELAKLNLT